MLVHLIRYPLLSNSSEFYLTAHVYFFVKTNANNGLYEPTISNNTGGTAQKIVTLYYLLYTYHTLRVSQNSNELDNTGYLVKCTSNTYILCLNLLTLSTYLIDYDPMIKPR